MSELMYRRWQWLFWVAVIVAFFFNIHAFALFDLDEGAYAETTREMLVRGDFITTYMNGEPFYDKPIMMYWLQALSVAIFGINEFAFRLPSALASTAWVYIIVLFVRRFYNPRIAYMTGSVVALSLLVAFVGKAAIPDGVLNLLITASMLLIFLYYKDTRKRYLYGAYAVMALGFLVKGPIAVFVPLVSSFIFSLSKGQMQFWLRSLASPIGWVIFLVIASPWYVAAYLAEGQAFLEGFFLKHNVGRFSQAMEGHGGSVLYYVPVVLLGMLPFTALLFLIIKKIKEVVRDDLMLYLLIWFLVVFVFFSISGTKLPHYLNYGLTGLLILAGLYLDKLRSRVLSLLPQLFFFLLCLFIPEMLAGSDSKHAYYSASLMNSSEVFDFSYRLFFIAAIIATLYMMREQYFSLAGKLIVSGMVTVIAVSGFVMPAVANLLQQPIKNAALVARELDDNVVRYRMNMPSFSVYSQRIVRSTPPQPGDVVFTSPDYVPELGNVEYLYRERGVALVRVLPAS